MTRISRPLQIAVSIVVLAVMLATGTLIAILYARYAVLTSQRQWCGTLMILIKHLPHDDPLYPAIVQQSQHFGCVRKG